MALEAAAAAAALPSPRGRSRLLLLLLPLPSSQGCSRLLRLLPLLASNRGRCRTAAGAATLVASARGRSRGCCGPPAAAVLPSFGWGDCSAAAGQPGSLGLLLPPRVTADPGRASPVARTFHFTAGHIPKGVDFGLPSFSRGDCRGGVATVRDLRASVGGLSFRVCPHLDSRGVPSSDLSGGKYREGTPIEFRKIGRGKIRRGS